MKTAQLLLIFLASASVSAAQGGAAPAGESPPGVVVVRVKWERQVEPLNNNSALPEYDASRGAVEPDALRDPGILRVPSTSPGDRPSYAYQYTAEIRNDGARRIEGLIWEYVLSDPATGREVGRHVFYSLDKIDAGKSRKLGGRSHLTPARTVRAAELGKKKAPAYAERVEFRCVMYEGGSFWRRPFVGESECQEMKDRRKMRERMRQDQ